MLELSGVSVGYDGTDVLRDVDLRVRRGELLCVLGPSGGGKSTLLRVVAGLEIPRTGTIRLDGRDLGGVPPHERGIGLMFQDYALFPHRDVGGNVVFGLRMQGLDAAAVASRVEALLELVGLPGTGRRPVSALSGGEQQRVALARALAPEPALLMLDEPLGSLDRALRERLPDELRSLFARLELTVIYVTHDQDEALSVADRVVILDEGRIVADGTPEALWTTPPSAWVARFLGARNVAPATLAGGRLASPWGELPMGGTVSDGQGPVTVVVRAAGIRLDTSGPLGGVVASRRFRGDHVVLAITVDGAVDAQPLLVEVRDTGLPALGEAVRLSIDPAAVHVIDDRPSPSAGPGGTL